MTRGSLYVLLEQLGNIRNTLYQIYRSEKDKEDGTGGGAPLIDSGSHDLFRAVQHILDAQESILRVADEEPDFATYPKLDDEEEE